MKRVILFILLSIAFALGVRAQMVNNIPNYLYSGSLGVGRSTANDANVYLQVGPNGAGTKGMIVPWVADTAAISGTKRNFLFIRSSQLGSFAYWDSVNARWYKIGFTDTTTISTRAYAQKIVNDTAKVLRALASTPDGVTSVATGNGLSGGTITSTGTLTADTSILSTKNNTQKVVNDSSAVLRALAGSSSPKISSLTAATGTNTINNADYAQEWQWNTATSGGLKLSSTSTAGTNNGKLFEIARSGANASSSITTYGQYTSVINTGTSSTNYGGYFTASGATSNTGVYAEGTTRGINGSTTGAFGEGVRGSGSSGTNTTGVVGTSSSASGRGVYGSVNGTSGTKYAGYFDVSGTGTTNYGVWATSAGGTTNYGLYIDAGISSLQGAINLKQVSKTATYTADATDYTIFCDATSGAITINLPAAGGTGAIGRIYIIKKTDSGGNAVTVDANGSETIDGATTYVLSTQYKYVVIQSNGTNWFIIGNN